MKIKRDFRCTQCGLCCQCISELLPEFDLGNGTCKWYNPETHLCEIYDDRPLICNVKRIWEEVLREKGISWKDWCDENYACCKKLQELHQSQEQDNLT